MSTDPLLASALLGTARRPLPEAEVAVAQSIEPAARSPARQALVLASVRSLQRRSEALRCLVPAAQVGEEVPPHPDYGPVAEAQLISFLEATRLLRGRADTRYLAARGLCVPAAYLFAYLEQALTSRGELPPDVVLALGERGLWLATRHPRHGRRLAFLAKPAAPASGWQRTVYLVHRLSRLMAGDDPSAHRARALAAAFGRRRAAEIEVAGAQPSEVESVVAARAVGSGDRPARSELLRARLADGPPTAALPGDEFAAHAAAAVVLADVDAADYLLRRAVVADDALVRRHPLLPALTRTLPALEFADFIDFAHPHFAQGWRDRALGTLLEASDYPVGEGASEEWLRDAARGHATVVQSLAVTHPHRLHPRAAGVAAELAHAQRADPTLAALLALLVARQRLDERFPVSPRRDT